MRDRAVNGILLLDKSVGCSSNHALQSVKRLFEAKKAGHTGSLDPLAEGMLPICFGEATKFSQFLLDAKKTYRVTATLGVITASGDAEGEVLQEQEPPIFSKKDLEKCCAAFRGPILQVPSMFSALKHQGKPLYKLARRGISIERAPRPVHILSVDDDLLHLTFFDVRSRVQ